MLTSKEKIENFSLTEMKNNLQKNFPTIAGIFFTAKKISSRKKSLHFYRQKIYNLLKEIGGKFYELD